MAEIANSTPASILQFPAGRARPPSWSTLSLHDEAWQQAFKAARISNEFRSQSPSEAADSVGAVIREFGAGAVARILEDNKVALSTLRGIVSSLAEADRRIAAAVAQALVSEGVVR